MRSVGALASVLVVQGCQRGHRALPAEAFIREWISVLQVEAFIRVETVSLPSFSSYRKKGFFSASPERSRAADFAVHRSEAETLRQRGRARDSW
jgi:hypothetical protein